MAIAIANACMPSIDKILNGEQDDEYENLYELEAEDIDLDKKLDIKRTINDDGELI